LIKNGTVVNHDRSFVADVLVSPDDGKIIRVSKTPIEQSAAARVIDATGKLIMPGGIDAHTHLEMPFMGTVTVDDWASGTRCAVAGGTTTIVDFIIPGRDASLVDALNAWKKKAEKACCNYAFHCAVTCWNEKVSAEYELLANEGVTSFKHFMAYKGALMLNDADLISSFGRCKELGLLPQVHAENGDLVAWLQRRTLNAGITGPIGHPMSRPANVEGEAAERACVIAHEVGTPLVVVHNTSEVAAAAVSRARQAGRPVFGEVTAIHLTIDDSRYADPRWEVAAHHVLSPPLRSKNDVEYLWNALHSGVLQFVSTDHCTFTTKQKEMGKNDFTKIPNGCPGLEERMLVVWEGGVAKKRISVEKFVEITSTFAARLYNMYPRKGAIMEGSDADIVIWDPEKPRTISVKTQQSKIDYNVFEGFTSSGSPVCTILNGRVAYENNTVVANEGDGKYVARGRFGLAYSSRP